jgi:uncharacterized repeat protein (TIGR03837 family)
MSSSNPAQATRPDGPPSPSPLWDVFCRVVDNYGDIGVCWRLAVDLARRGQRVRLWIDDASALRWMAPDGEPGVEVVQWLAEMPCPAPGDVVVEAFGCDPPASFVAAMAAAARPPAWINLEYLSAESYVERSHGLPSPQMSGPGRGLVKWFFYPGFTAATGGLLHEIGLEAEQQAFERDAWLASRGIAPRAGERLVSLFCYPGAPVERLAAALVADGVPTLVATSPGAATTAMRSALAAPRASHGAPAVLLRQHELPWLSQRDYDRLLWACDLNFVRGEDSWARAQWAGRPFVWQAYVQDDGAQFAKVEAFLALALARAHPDAAAQIRRWHEAWNGFAEQPGGTPLPPWTTAAIAAAADAARSWRAQLRALPDLVTTLMTIAAKKR